MKDRIRQIMEAQHMTQQTFASFIGLSPATLSGIFTERTRPTLDTVMLITNKLPHINIEWLLQGKGSMFNDERNQTNVVDSNDGVTSQEQVLDFSAPSHSTISTGDFNRQATSKGHNSMMMEVRNTVKPIRHITEIRVFYDDLTYESFVPKK
ncbi:MAG: helix-turn-helix transcriptional regulator [Prevotella sp.]|nr:helix-turn-helix transcriptional regulator [Prevotella sp.]